MKKQCMLCIAAVCDVNTGSRRWCAFVPVVWFHFGYGLYNNGNSGNRSSRVFFAKGKKGRM